MHGTKLMKAVSRHLSRPLEGIVLRRYVGSRALAHRVRPEEQVDLDAYSEVIALIPLSVEEIIGEAEARISMSPELFITQEIP